MKYGDFSLDIPSVIDLAKHQGVEITMPDGYTIVIHGTIDISEKAIEDWRTSKDAAAAKDH